MVWHPVRPIWRLNPALQRRSRGANVRGDGIVAKDGDGVTAFHQLSGRAQLWRNVAAAIDHGKYVATSFHRTSPADSSATTMHHHDPEIAADDQQREALTAGVTAG